jgi:D-tyrosyl-tRNA(Tyr) deacylase
MRVVIQRVAKASVHVDSELISSIGMGLLVLVGIESADQLEDLEWISKKLLQLRIFNDDWGKMNFCLEDVQGELLVVSQFTLHAQSKKGNRPSYIRAARPEIAIPLYENFLSILSESIGKRLSSGSFGADMKVTLINDGPVTILHDSQNKDLF